MKRKLFKSLLAVALICTGSNAWAVTPNLTAAYEVAGYKAKAYYNLASSNIGDMCPTSGDVRYRDTYGLFNFGSGNRSGAITIAVSKDDLIIFEAIQSQTYDNAINSVSDCTKNETISTGAYWAYDVTTDATSLTINITRAEYIPAILVMEKDNTVKTVDYTIKYVDSNNQSISDDLVLNGVVGVEVSAASSQTEPKYVDAQKYLYVSGNTPITLVENASSNVITLVYRAANTYTYKVKSSLGTEFANSSAFEEDVVYVTNPQYELIDNVLWEATKGSDWYQRSYTLTSNVDETITYTKTAIENVVLYMEGEDISGASVGSNTARASKGQMGYTSGSDDFKNVTTLPAGKYQIFLRGVNGNKDARAFSFKVGETEVFSGSIANGTNILLNSGEFTVSAAGVLSVSCAGSSTSGLDWFYVKATGYPVSVSYLGWATAFTPYALDFSGTGLTAYTATCDGSTVTLTPVTSVPANTGVVLEGAEGNYTIPFAASPESEQGSLTGSATEATDFAAVDGKTLYVLALNGSGKVQFQPVTSGEIAAGKAYLPLAKSSGVKALSVAFGTATGINAVESARQDGMMFNLAGQRVSMPARGLYIKNGKKVVVK